MPTREQLWKQWEWEHEFTYLDTDGTRQFKPIQQPMSEQNTPRLMPVNMLNDVVKAANRKYPNAYDGQIFEFMIPQSVPLLSRDFLENPSETCEAPPIYRLQLIDGQWNLIL